MVVLYVGIGLRRAAPSEAAQQDGRLDRPVCQHLHRVVRDQRSCEASRGRAGPRRVMVAAHAVLAATNKCLAQNNKPGCFRECDVVRWGGMPKARVMTCRLFLEASKCGRIVNGNNQLPKTIEVLLSLVECP